MWRNGTRWFIGAYDNDSTFNPAKIGANANGNHMQILGNNGMDLGNNYSLAFYSNKLPGADATHKSARDYTNATRWVDPVTGADEVGTAGSTKRAMMVYDYGFPTTIGVDVKWKVRQYTMNWNNMNDFIVCEITLKNTGVVDIDGDGNSEKTNHKIQGLAIGLWDLPGIAVRIGTSGTRSSNDFGAGRYYGYVADNDPKTGLPTDAYVDEPGPNPLNILSDGTIPAGKRDMGINAYGLRNYTEVWNGWRWLGAKQGDSKYSNPDKKTMFGSHAIGEGADRGKYISIVDGDKFFSDLLNPRNFFVDATATWRNQVGRINDPNIQDRSFNPSYFASGNGEDITTWVPKASPGVPDGDRKLTGFSKFPPYEDGWKKGFTDHEDFNGEMFYGLGPFSLDVNETMTIVFVDVGGYRLQGVQGALRAAEWAWTKDWNIFPELPAAPDIKVENTATGTVLVRWTDAANADGYKVWKASQYKKLRYQDLGIRLVDRYQEQQTVGADITGLLQPINPNFDAWSYLATEQGYQPDAWGTYDLVAVIPKSGVSSYANSSVPGFQYAYEDKNAVLGFRYWYYVAAYKDGSFSGPAATSTSRIETANFTRNGADGFWKGTYPYANVAPEFPAATDVEGLRRIGAAFVATPPLTKTADLTSGNIKIGVRPNPYKRAAYFDNRQDFADHKVAFYNLPDNCKITIVDVSGQLINVLDIKGGTNGLYFWNMFSKDGIEVASGLYMYLVEWAGGSTKGYFSILR
jgi:hypothetical protein